MTKRQETMDKAKESGKKIVEGGKKFGAGAGDVVWGTAKLLGHAFKSGGEIGISEVFRKRSKNLNYSDQARKEYKEKAEEYSKRAKKSIGKAGESTKQVAGGLGNAIKGGAKVVGHTMEGGYHLIDAGDKAIGEKITEKRKEKGENKVGKMRSFMRNNTIKLLIALGVVGYGGYQIVENGNDKEKTLIEMIDNSKKLSFEEKLYFQNPDFFDKNFKVIRDEKYKDQGVILIRDAGMTFYIVQNGENSKEKIRRKLSSIPEFSYLKDSVYDNKIMGFNVPNASLKGGLYVPIPVQAEDRKIDINQFKEYARVAIHEMEGNPNYGEMMKRAIKEVGEERIIDIMTAFARCETSIDHRNFSDPIGNTELHRWEEKFSSFSFSYYHILMEKNADGKTAGPGLKARLNLGLTEGQCYHPINAGKLFLGYCFEKKSSDPTYFFRINNLVEARGKGRTYNGDKNYGKKLWDNIQHISKK